MKAEKRKKLEKAGWKVGSTEDFLDLTPEEAAFVEIKLALARDLKRLRQRHNWTQTQVARKINSSQSRVAKMEVADPSVTLDLLVRSLLAMGTSTKEVARIIDTGQREHAV